MSYLLILIMWALVIIALTLLMNVFIFPRLQRTTPPADAPSVSVLIPARNEAAVIQQTIRKLKQQTYPNYEMIVLDDDSDDDTAHLARKAERVLSPGNPFRLAGVAKTGRVICSRRPPAVRFWCLLMPMYNGSRTH